MNVVVNALSQDLSLEIALAVLADAFLKDKMDWQKAGHINPGCQ